MKNINHLKKWRLSMKLTQKEAALLIGVSQPSYSRYEQNSAQPSPLTAKTIEEVTQGAVTRILLRPDVFGGAHA